jgi:DNA-damage-inducible protein J
LPPEGKAWGVLKVCSLTLLTELSKRSRFPASYSYSYFASILGLILVYNELQKGDCKMKVQTSMRIEEATFNEAKAILASLGMNFTDAVNIFVSMVVQTKGLPFEVKLPNAETLQAMQEVRDGKNIDDFKIEELRQ